MDKFKKIAKELSLFVCYWFLASVLASLIKSHTPYNDVSNCGKTYPIDYVFYTDLFCEVKSQKNN